jgi:chloramphenicol-sensitive protein RarD
MWGIFPLFFHLLRNVPSTEVLLHRVVWSFLFVFGIVLLMRRQGRFFRALRQPELLRGLAISSLLVSSNWLIFIWAVAQGRVLESSLGYFLTPLVSVFLARLVLGETLDRWRKTAIVLAIQRFT